MNININFYVIALYEAIKDDDPLAYLVKLDDFVKLLAADEEVAAFLVKTYSQFEVVEDLLKSEFGDRFTNFLSVLYEERRLKAIVEIRDLYAKLLMENKLLSIVDIYSKEKLSEAAENQILKMLENKYPKPYRTTLHIDESLLGGYLLKVNGDIYDTSLKSKLSKMQKLGGVINE